MVVTCDQYQHKDLALQCLCAVCRQLCQRNMEDDIKNSQETGRLPAEVLTKLGLRLGFGLGFRTGNLNHIR